MWDAGSRQRRHWILQSVHLRRQQGELTGYSFQIRLLSCGVLREGHQHGRVLLLRQLDILQCRDDDGIRYRGWSRLLWRLCSNAIGIGRRGAIEIRQREVIEFRDGDVIEFREREAIEIRPDEAIEVWQRVGSGRANDGQGGQRHQCRRQAAPSPLLNRVRLLVSLRFLSRCLSHLRSPRVRLVVTFSLAADRQNKNSYRVDDPPTALARLPAQIVHRSWAYMVNDQLFSASCVWSSTAGC